MLDSQEILKMFYSQKTYSNFVKFLNHLEEIEYGREDQGNKESTGELGEGFNGEATLSTGSCTPSKSGDTEGSEGNKDRSKDKERDGEL